MAEGDNVYNLQKRLLELIENEKIILDEQENLPGDSLGIYIKDPGMSYPIIGVCKNLCYCEYNSVLAEELGHHFTSTGTSTALFHHHPGRLTLSKVEESAIRWGTEFALPIPHIIAAIENNISGTIVDIANELSVTADFLMHRLRILSLTQDYIKINDTYKLVLCNYPNLHVVRDSAQHSILVV